MANPEPNKPFPTPAPQAAAKAPVQPAPVPPTEVKPAKATPRPRRPWSDYLPIATIVLLVLWISQLVLMQVMGDTTNRQLTDYAKLQQQLSDQKQAAAAIAQHTAEIELLSKAFPSEDGIIEFINQIKTQTVTFQESRVQISNNQPIKTENLVAPFLPVLLNFTATPSATVKLLEDLSHSRYLVQPGLLEIAASAGLAETAKINFKGNLYASNELIR